MITCARDRRAAVVMMRDGEPASRVDPPKVRRRIEVASSLGGSRTGGNGLFRGRHDGPTARPDLGTEQGE